MIKLIKKGKYKMIETKMQTKILYLGRTSYAWINAKDIGEILITSHTKHTLDCILSIGEYRIYNVKDEKKLTDLQHLELEVGENTWQGYLLTTGLPNKKDSRKRIIPTDELVLK